MKANDNSDQLFEALFVAATSEAMRREMETIPSIAELDVLYETDELDTRIEKLISRSSRIKRVRRRLYSLGRVVAILAVIFTITTVLLMSVEATRVRIINTFFDWQRTHVNISPRESDDGGGLIIGRAKFPAYLPEGFTEKEAYDFGPIFETVYENQSGEQIMFTQRLAEDATLNVDNEHSDYQRIAIWGGEAYLFISDDANVANILCWIADDTLYKLEAKINHEELILIAESIK